MLNNVLFGESIPRLQQGLDTAALRQKVTADNIANVATPGYQARRVVFEDLLRGRMLLPRRVQLAAPESGAGLGLAPSATARARVQVDTAPDLRSGVNNVDIEREMASLQKTVLQHSAITQLLTAKYRLVRQAIVDR